MGGEGGGRVSNRGGFISEILAAGGGGAKRGIQCFAVVQWGDLVEAGVSFFVMRCKNNFSILSLGHVQNINSLTAAMSHLNIM